MVYLPHPGQLHPAGAGELELCPSLRAGIWKQSDADVSPRIVTPWPTRTSAFRYQQTAMPWTTHPASSFWRGHSVCPSAHFCPGHLLSGEPQPAATCPVLGNSLFTRLYPHVTSFLLSEQLSHLSYLLCSRFWVLSLPGISKDAEVSRPAYAHAHTTLFLLAWMLTQV